MAHPPHRGFTMIPIHFGKFGFANRTMATPDMQNASPQTSGRKDAGTAAFLCREVSGHFRWAKSPIANR